MDGESAAEQYDHAKTRASGKFNDPVITADGAKRASVALTRLETLWVNTGTQCNIECASCYIESSPSNDRLSYITADELAPYLKEARAMGAREIAFTGGEPFLNPQMIVMTRNALEAGFEVLILTNAMRPMMRPAVRNGLLTLREEFGTALKLRISIDHYTAKIHDRERGNGAFAAMREGVCWLSENNFQIAAAGRQFTGENENELRSGFDQFFGCEKILIDAHDPAALILFPEMNIAADVPEITTDCWGVLNKAPSDVMCSTSRMLVKRKGASAPAVLACTLLPYDKAFELGETLADAATPVSLNHPFCAQFCVLGGASCAG